MLASMYRTWKNVLIIEKYQNLCNSLVVTYAKNAVRISYCIELHRFGFLKSNL